MKKFLAAMLVASLLAPSAANAESVLAQFKGSGCFARTYDKAHLAKHPVQTVRRISLKRSPDQVSPGRTILRLRVQFRNSGEIFEGEAYCSPSGSGAQCGIEGDGGTFAITMRGGDLRMNVSRISLEGSDFVDFGSDDRVLLLRKGSCI